MSWFSSWADERQARRLAKQFIETFQHRIARNLYLDPRDPIEALAVQHILREYGDHFAVELMGDRFVIQPIHNLAQDVSSEVRDTLDEDGVFVRGEEDVARAAFVVAPYRTKPLADDILEGQAREAVAKAERERERETRQEQEQVVS